MRFALVRRQIRFWTWVAMTVAGPILVFFNLYVVHDYYAIAVSGSIAALVGLGVAGLGLVRVWLRGVLVTGAAVAWMAVWAVHVPYWTRIYEPAADPEGVLPLAAQIQRETSPDQRVAILGRDWSPAILYYAHRWGWMLRGGDVAPGMLDQLLADGYAIYRCPWGTEADHCDRIDAPALGEFMPSATIGPVAGRTRLLASTPWPIHPPIWTSSCSAVGATWGCR